jgi:glycosyltransferase involved in cell wall biosynthesis
MEELISIIMPVRDAQRYLAECIDSIIGQSESNWELIAVNDHSIDNSPTILREYSKKDYRIIIADSDGKGIIPALRKGYSLSSGQFITRMDGDDLMKPHKLETLRKDLKNHGPGNLAIGLVEYFSEHELRGGYKKYEQWLNNLSRSGNNFEEVYKECVIPSPCWMAYRVDFESIGAFNANRYPEDYDLCFRFYGQKIKVIPSSEVLHAWRDYPERTSRNDPNYADNRFIPLKLEYFLELDRNRSHPLIIWGAGRKGKDIVSFLQNSEESFHWICNNPEKIGKHIFDILLESTSLINHLDSAQIIIAVANESEQTGILKQIKSANRGHALFAFC